MRVCVERDARAAERDQRESASELGLGPVHLWFHYGKEHPQSASMLAWLPAGLANPLSVFEPYEGQSPGREGCHKGTISMQAFMQGWSSGGNGGASFREPS